LGDFLVDMAVLADNLEKCQKGVYKAIKKTRAFKA